MRRMCCLFLSLVVSAGAHAIDLDGLGGDLLKDIKGGAGQGIVQTPPRGSRVARLSEGDVVKGLKQALDQGAVSAVRKLGRKNGFLGNQKVKIPLPGALQKISGLLRAMGQGEVVDELVVTMNRAAEQAVPQARTLLVGAVKQMSVRDAKSILGGEDNAATQYFRKTTERQLHDRFLPIVSRTVGRLGVAKRYDSLAGKAARLGLVDEKQASIQEYVTQKALNGLFFMIAEEERAIRKNPAQRTGYWVKKVFGAIGGPGKAENTFPGPLRH